MSIVERIKELGYKLPEAPKPVAAYIPAVQAGNLVYTSGVLPMLDGKVAYLKEIGGYLNTISYGYEAAKLCTLNALSVIHDFVGLDNVEKIIKVTGYVHNVSGFTDQPKILNGASDLLLEIFGEAGKHARSAVGVNGLPLGASVELDMVVQIK
ncbi:MAG: endoribonuclease L-PSP [uncultured bacterium]|nr:MAG: endoribonuclease L-PSP [uncultured bacterium]